jgi:predicted neuraminidase
MRMQRPTAKIVLLIAAAAAFLAFWWMGMGSPGAAGFAPSGGAGSPETESARRANAEPVFRERFASRSDTAEVHAATAYIHRADGLTAFWYGGSREGASDVAVYSARLEDSGWDQPRVVVERNQMTAQLSRKIRKIGNSIVHQHPDGRLWLFFVTVSVGGWAGSSINLIESADNGLTWSPAKRLVTSPFFNLSTLVKGSAFRYADGTVGLPVYHEFVGKFGELLRLDPTGRVIGKTRFTSGRHALQPEIAVLTKEKAVGLLRYAGPPPSRVLYTFSEDSGRSWSTPQKLHLPNPDSAIDVLALPDGRILAVLNDIEDARWRLVLAQSDNQGRDWRTIKVLEHEQDAVNPKRHEFSYPWLLRSDDDVFHLLYTWNRSRIKHIEFNRTWLDQAAATSDQTPSGAPLAKNRP